ncbi:MAG: hypothetical protein ABL869_08355 [Candidatus Nitrotoga sp.]
MVTGHACGIPNEMMEKGVVRRKRTAPELAHPNAAGIDIGSASHFVAVSPDRDQRDMLLAAQGRHI